MVRLSTQGETLTRLPCCDLIFYFRLTSPAVRLILLRTYPAAPLSALRLPLPPLPCCNLQDFFGSVCIADSTDNASPPAAPTWCSLGDLPAKLPRVYPLTLTSKPAACKRLAARSTFEPLLSRQLGVVKCESHSCNPRVVGHLPGDLVSCR